MDVEKGISQCIVQNPQEKNDSVSEVSMDIVLGSSFMMAYRCSCNHLDIYID